MFCPIYRTKLVRETSRPFSAKLNSTEAATRIVSQMLADSPSEQFVTVLLDVKLRPIGAHVATVGTLDSSLVHPREVFRPAFLSNAHALILAHNHPSGELTPSRQDWSVFDKLRNCGEILGLPCLDSIIVAADEQGRMRGNSMAEREQRGDR
jgi:DNA repair protein RadC